MMEFLQEHQLSIMLFLSGICFILTVLTLLTKSIPPKRRRILASLEAAAMFLLIFDRFAYIYRGDLSSTGFWMVRISNFLVFLLSILLPHFFNLYLIDLYRNEGGMKRVPKRLLFSEVLFTVGMILLVISQFTGLYYYFDEQNLYHRAPGYVVCFIIPLLILFLQLTIIIQHRKDLRRRILFPLLLFTLVPLCATILQYFAYGLSLTNITMVGMAIILYIFALVDLNDSLANAKQNEIDILKNEQKRINNAFEQTAEALATAIDAKDPYTHGHSSRVADYSVRIAQAAGKSEEECRDIFFTALLHDVGKIGIPDYIINKKGRLTDEEFAEIKKHPVVGHEILSRISESPFLSIGAHYHHERYGGGGYPDGLKGEEIPEIARIIAVADAYDAMTSNRSYRSAIPQHIVREELVKGIGTQFDPVFGRIMIQMLDHDIEYTMQETETDGDGPTCPVNLHCSSLYEGCTDGFAVTNKKTSISLTSHPDETLSAEQRLPSLILYDSLDGKVHPGQENNKELLYFEYALIRFDGQVTGRNIRNTDIRILDPETDLSPDNSGEAEHEQYYRIEAVRFRDHAMIQISDRTRTTRIILALPDSTRFSYIAIGGEHCYVHNIQVRNDENEIGPDAIPRIAEEISFIRGCPEGDVPNIQVDGWRTEATAGIPIRRGETTLSFHSMSLPTARLVWHCPFLCVFSSADGRVSGEAFREYILLRLDGENWESNEHAENHIQVDIAGDFRGWNDWISRNKQGQDCTVTITRNRKEITMQTENMGITVRSTTLILDEELPDLYVALTGDQVALTDIHVKF